MVFFSNILSLRQVIPTLKQQSDRYSMIDQSHYERIEANHLLIWHRCRQSINQCGEIYQIYRPENRQSILEPKISAQTSRLVCKQPSLFRVIKHILLFTSRLFPQQPYDSIDSLYTKKYLNFDSLSSKILSNSQRDTVDTSNIQQTMSQDRYAQISKPKPKDNQTLIDHLHNILMSNNNYPVPPGHRLFQFGKITIDSNFDSGNCSHAEKTNSNSFSIWVAADHPRNGYRGWFYFSVQGVGRGTTLHFQIMNMQNTVKLLQEGLAPVFREEGNCLWRRVSHRVNLANVSVNDNEMEWTFSHTFATQEKHYFAFCYPWSNDENSRLLDSIQARAALSSEIYFHRAAVINSLEGRPVEMLTISSKRGLTGKDNFFDEPCLFQNGSKPKVFDGDKRCVIISARVHPGQVPGSHVMTGILNELVEESPLGEALRDKFIFYVFPILNPDGVARGHFRVDTNGINLNRCYINPSPKDHPSIYAIKRVIMQSYADDRYFGFLDLHAQASRKGNFIYGNSLNELGKQVDACLFPKILAMNSPHFEYEGSNFMEKHMYHKDKADHMSKEGCGRVAVYHATRNPNSWTLECSYNTGQTINILQPRAELTTTALKTDQDSLDPAIIRNYKQFPTEEMRDFYTVQTYHNLGQQICESLLDLIEANPASRIVNNESYFRNVNNIKLNLAVALVKMAPNRFESQFRKIHFMMEGTESQKVVARCYRALYFLVIRRAKLPNLAEYLKDEDNTVLFPPQKSVSRQLVRRKTAQALRPSPKSISPNIRAAKGGKISDDNDRMDTQSVVLTLEDSSPQRRGNTGFSSLLSKKNTPVINIVEIDKQIHLKTPGKDEFRMLAVSNLQGRYESQHQITNYSSYKRKGKIDEQSLRRTYNQVFKLQILPKLMNQHKAVLNIAPLKHQLSLK